MAGAKSGHDTYRLSESCGSRCAFDKEILKTLNMEGMTAFNIIRDSISDKVTRADIIERARTELKSGLF